MALRTARRRRERLCGNKAVLLAHVAEPVGDGPLDEVDEVACMGFLELMEFCSFSFDGEVCSSLHAKYLQTQFEQLYHAVEFVTEERRVVVPCSEELEVTPLEHLAEGVVPSHQRRSHHFTHAEGCAHVLI